MRVDIVEMPAHLWIGPKGFYRSKPLPFQRRDANPGMGLRQLGHAGRAVAVMMRFVQEAHPGLVDPKQATLISLAAGAGERLGIPHRRAQIYGGGYKAMVLYAEPTRITLGYTRDDSVANGYTVHLEGICVDPNLVTLYRNSNGAGRGFLPALREDEVLGTAPNGSVLIAVRDRGVFFDPRSRLDWWQGF